MSCQLREVSRINSDIFASLQKFFLDDKRPAPPHSSSNQEETDEPPSKTFLTSTDDAFLSETESDDGDNAAEEDSGLKNWSLESSDAEPTVDENCKWLKNCLISSTPNMDLVVLGAVQKFVILEESLKLSNRLDVAAWVTITGPHFNSLTDYISSVYTFCIASTRTAEPSLVDWTCICIGLSNGYVHFYTERGVLIFVEQCSQSAIKAIKLGSSIYPGNQELAILTAESKLIVIEGLSLFTTLKTARNQMARMERTVEEISSLLQLNCHCLELDRLRRVHEFQMLGLIKPGSFDQYITAARSALGKYAKVTRTSLPTYNNYFCCTSNYSTFGSFLWHDAEISGSAVISDAIYNFTSQITNSMPSFGIRSWLGVGTSRKDRPVKTSAIDSRSRRVPLRSSLEDKERIGERCYVAPAGWPLVAIADSCARVLLVHVHNRQIVRIWKGYRNARCAWIESSSSADIKTNKRYYKSKAKTLFLAIFAPKRDLLEIWSIENGPRVSAFKVDRRGRLLPLPSAQEGTLLGTSSEHLTSTNANNSVVFLSPCGKLFTINVPFHHSAMDVSVSSIHDENLLKEFSLRSVLSDTENHNTSHTLLDVDKWIALSEKLKTPSAKRRYVENLLNTVDFESRPDRCDTSIISSTDALLAVQKLYGETQITIEQSSKTRRYSDSSGLCLFLSYLAEVQTVLETYNEVKKAYERQQTTEYISEYDDLKNCLRISDQQMTEINLSLIRELNESRSDRSKTNKIALNFKAFKDQFEYSPNNFSGHPINENTSKNILTVRLKPFEGQQLIDFGATLFAPFVFGWTDISVLRDILSRLETTKMTLINAFLAFWLDKEWNTNPQAFTITSTEILKQLISDYGESACRSNLKEIFEQIEKTVFLSTYAHAALSLWLQICAIRNQLYSDESSSRKRIKLSHNDEENQLINRNDTDETSNAREGQDFNETEGSAPEIANEDEFLVLNDDDIASYNAAHDWDYAKHLSAISLLQSMPFNKSTHQCQVIFGENLSMDKLARTGLGFYREQIGVWASQYEPNARDMAYLFSGQEPPETETTPNNQNHLEESIKQVIKALLSLFPKSLAPELILCDCCWESASAWFKDESRRTTKLSLSADFLDLLEPAPRLQHGLALMVWNTFLKTPFENLVALVNANENKLLSNKDRILRRDVLVVESDLIEFIACVRNLLRSLTDAAFRWENDTPYRHCYEPFVQRFFQHSQTANSGSASRTLSQLADKHKCVNYHLVLHHIHLTIVLELQISLNISIRINGLFDAIGRRAFFDEFHSHPLVPLGNVDDRTRDRRQQFLEQVIECIGSTTTATIGESQLPTKDAFYRKHWNMTMDLAKDWQLDIDKLQMKEITLLYEWGFDDEAEKMVVAMQNHKLLAMTMVPLIAARIKSILEEDPKLQIKVFQCSAAPESTVDYVKQLPEDLAPKFDGVQPRRVRKMISLATNLFTRASKQDRKPSTRSNSPTFTDAALNLRTLKEFDEICQIAEKSKTATMSK